MTRNRIEELLRDPTFETPRGEYFEVRTPWFGVCVTRESAERILEAMTGLHRAEWVRAETVEGSTVHVRVEHVIYVRQWTQAQRETGRQFWKEIDQEYEDKDEQGGSSGEEEAVPGGEGVPEAHPQPVTAPRTPGSGAPRLWLGALPWWFMGWVLAGLVLTLLRLVF